MYTFGVRLRNARESKKLTQRELAKLINVAYTSISEWENDHHRPGLDTLKVLCGILDVKASWLLSSDATPTPNPEMSAYARGELDELSAEAKKEIDDFIKYIKVKYKKSK